MASVLDDLAGGMADLFDPPGSTRLWYCADPACDGHPHPGAHWCAHPLDGEHLPECRHARPDQRPPQGDWLVWAYIAGRGTGKTRAMAEWVTDLVRNSGYERGALVGRTPADVRDVMIEGESGLIAVGASHGFRPVWQPTKRRIVWPNGAIAFSYSAEVGDQLRGPQHDFAWVDEPAAWTDARLGDRLGTAWNNLMLGLRLGKSPRVGFSTTPKPVALVRQVLDRPTTQKTHATTYQNLENLAPTFRQEVLAAYEGTRVGRQELLGELLTDVEGALWSLDLLDTYRVDVAPDLAQIVVGVDPTGTNHQGSDECGIVVAGKSADANGYVMADRSAVASPAEWARRAVGAYHEFSADKIVAEANFGGQMVADTIRAVDRNVPVELVTASRGKRQRAEPVAALYEQGRVHHVGALALLEDQMTTWVPESGMSPDRMDALVWALTSLNIPGGGQGQGFAEAWRQLSAKADADLNVE